jgi:hypothetical protein
VKLLKIYLIDKYRKNTKLIKALEESGITNIEQKEDINYRINKTDIVISTDGEVDYDGYQKINNLIILTKTNEKNQIWNMANKLNTKDIIQIKNNNEGYIAERIKKCIGEIKK